VRLWLRNLCHSLPEVSLSVEYSRKSSKLVGKRSKLLREMSKLVGRWSKLVTKRSK
jgi:hypothetical protein